MQVALSTSWMAVLAAEMVGAQEGCGWMIQRGSDTLNITLVMVGMIVIGCVCAGEYTVLGQLALFAAISLAVQVICRLVHRHRKRGQADQQD